MVRKCFDILSYLWLVCNLVPYFCKNMWTLHLPSSLTHFSSVPISASFIIFHSKHMLCFFTSHPRTRFPPLSCARCWKPLQDTCSLSIIDFHTATRPSRSEVRKRNSLLGSVCWSLCSLFFSRALFQFFWIRTPGELLDFDPSKLTFISIISKIVLCHFYFVSVNSGLPPNICSLTCYHSFLLFIEHVTFTSRYSEYLSTDLFCFDSFHAGGKAHHMTVVGNSLSYIFSLLYVLMSISYRFPAKQELSERTAQRKTNCDFFVCFSPMIKV